ncbi:MAG: small multi-drug export protein [Syntrophobacteraceae bacterium]
MQDHIKDHHLFYFIALYALGGKPTAIIAARFLGLNLLLFVPLVVVMDAAQISCFYYLYGHAFKHHRMAQFSAWLKQKASPAGGSRPAALLGAMGRTGLVAFTMVPCKGFGIWSGVFIARLMGLPIRSCFPLLIAGSVLACLLFAGLGEGMLQLWKSFGQP